MPAQAEGAANPGASEAPAAASGPPGSAPERRSGDRRRSDRRRRVEPATNWPAPGEGDWQAPAAMPDLAEAGDPRLRALGAEALSGGHDNGEGAQLRVFRTYMAARAAVGVGLVAVQGVLALLGVRTVAASVLVSIAYAVQALTLWLLPRFRQQEALTWPGKHGALRQRQWLATIGVDLLAFATLHLLQLGASFNFAALLVLPVLMGGVMTPRLPALATAAGVTLLLLLAAWRLPHGDADYPIVMMQAGLAGLGFFAIALLAGELAGRLAREEQAARGSLELARQQAALNRMVIEEMADGVLVVDAGLWVRAANPAARALLAAEGLSPPAPFDLRENPAWRELSEAVSQGLHPGSEHSWPDIGRDLSLRFDDGSTRTLRLRARMLRSPGAESTAALSLAVLMLEDLRTAQARIRQEKLAAMGRMSAGIAHEIRNPLAAIAQANSLLLEDLPGQAQQRLLGIVADNVHRLKRLVDDVMEVAPGGEAVRRVIDATREVAAVSAEWAATVGLPLGGSSRLRASVPALPLGVVFDAEHLRRVLVNLLDNAHRHASDRAGAIELELRARDEFSAQIRVSSDSKPLPADVERYLFEPFFSTRSRGSGLGLYICRELCERYGASIEYRPGGGAQSPRNDFIVTLRRAAVGEAEATLPLHG